MSMYGIVTFKGFIMKISSSVLNVNSNSSVSKNLYTHKLSSNEVTNIKEQIAQNSNAYTFNSTSIQSNIAGGVDKVPNEHQDFQNFLKDIGYDGKSISELSPKEASSLVSEDGIFGIKQTSERIANFVINGANGNEDLLRAGRKGMLQGFKDAQSAFGSKLPDISQKTMQKAVELVDKAMHNLGFSILDKEV